MKKIKFFPSRYLLVLSLFFLLSKSTTNFAPLTLALLCGLLFADFNKPTLVVMSAIPSLFPFNLEQLLVTLCSSGILTTFFLFYKDKKKPRFELVLYLIASLTPYLLYGGVTTIKAVYISIILPLCFISIVAIRVFFINGFSYKLTKDEIFSISIFTCFIGLGAVSVFGQELYKSASLLIILLSALSAGTSSLAVALILALPSCVKGLSLDPIAIFSLYAIASLSCVEYSRLLASVTVLGVELLLIYATPLYPSYSMVGICSLIVALFSFAFLPKPLAERLQENLYRFREKRLPKVAINRARLTLSAKLYEVSCAFSEMYSSIADIKSCTLSEEQIKGAISTEVVQSVCLSCPLGRTCKIKGFPTVELMQKLSSIGLARGKLTLVDLPIEFTRNCSFSNNILYSYNQQISKYYENLKLNKAFSDETELLGLQTSSIAGVLKQFACDYSKTLIFHSEQERKILKTLHQSGIKVSEVMVLGEGQDCEINIVIEKSEYDSKNLSYAVSQGIGFSVHPTKSINLSQNHLAVCYKLSPPLDAVFGLAQVAKNGKTSGDTHSLIKLGVGKFIVAINDGMGSGEKANQISSIATSLLESFFKAGLGADLALKTVNKVLSVTSTDTFTALDLAIIDLYKGFAQFIKIGSPYGYLLAGDSIKIIEANSLPMGISDLEFSPAQTALASGDILLMISDGVSDAFGSSTDILDYLKSTSVKNPQKLADSVIEKALSIQGSPKDDMTALCVRIYKK